VGTKAEIDARFQAKQRIDRPDAILSPGLINTHTHAAMSLFRGIADDLRLQDWLEKFIFPAEAKNVSAEFVRWGTRLGVMEMLLSGTTHLQPTCTTSRKWWRRRPRRPGCVASWGRRSSAFPVADNKTPADALAYAERYLARFQERSADCGGGGAARAVYEFR